MNTLFGNCIVIGIIILITLTIVGKYEDKPKAKTENKQECNLIYLSGKYKTKAEFEIFTSCNYEDTKSREKLRF